VKYLALIVFIGTNGVITIAYYFQGNSMRLKNVAQAIATLVLLNCPIASTANVEVKMDSDVGKELELPVMEWLDPQKPEKAIVIAVHGLTLYAGCFDDIGKHLARDGYHLYALDMRGFGRWRKDGASYGGDTAIHIGQSQKDLLRMVERIRKDNPTAKLIFLGESQGANLALWVIENNPKLTDGAIIFSPCYKTRIHPTPHWIPTAFRQMIKPDCPIDLEPYTRPYLTNDKALTERCDHDPLVNRTMTPAELIKCLIENRAAVKSLRKIPANYPIMIISGAEDGVFRSTRLPKEVHKFGDAQDLSLHMLAGKGHLLIEHQPVDPVIGDLVDKWLAIHTK
jgi:alpha-beta hydrolase superfamily lysophospholipase